MTLNLLLLICLSLPLWVPAKKLSLHWNLVDHSKSTCSLKGRCVLSLPMQNDGLNKAYYNHQFAIQKQERLQKSLHIYSINQNIPTQHYHCRGYRRCVSNSSWWGQRWENFYQGVQVWEVRDRVSSACRKRRIAPTQLQADAARKPCPPSAKGFLSVPWKKIHWNSNTE